MMCQEMLHMDHERELVNVRLIESMPKVSQKTWLGVGGLLHCQICSPRFYYNQLWPVIGPTLT
jgi:hypothetical protein